MNQEMPNSTLLEHRPEQEGSVNVKKNTGIIGRMRRYVGGIAAAIIGSVTGCAHLSPQEKACTEILDIRPSLSFEIENLSADGQVRWTGKKERCERHRKNSLPLLENGIKVCQNEYHRLRAFEKMGIIAEICEDFDSATRYFEEGLGVAKRSPVFFKRTANEFRSRLLLTGITTEACQAVADAELARNLAEVARGEKAGQIVWDQAGHRNHLAMMGEKDMNEYYRRQLTERQILVIEDQIDKCGNKFARLNGFVTLGGWHEESDPLRAENYYKKAIEVADELQNKLGPFKYNAGCGRVTWETGFDSGDCVYELHQGKAYVKNRQQAENGLRRLPKRIEEQKRIARESAEREKYKPKLVGSWRPGIDPNPNEPGADFMIGWEMFKDVAKAIAPHVPDIIEGVWKATAFVCKNFPGACSPKTPATTPGNGEIEVSGGAACGPSVMLGSCHLTGISSGVSFGGPYGEKTCFAQVNSSCTIPNLSPGKYDVRVKCAYCRVKKAGPVQVTVEPNEKIKVDFTKDLE